MNSVCSVCGRELVFVCIYPGVKGAGRETTIDLYRVSGSFFSQTKLSQRHELSAGEPHDHDALRVSLEKPRQCLRALSFCWQAHAKNFQAQAGWEARVEAFEGKERPGNPGRWRQVVPGRFPGWASATYGAENLCREPSRAFFYLMETRKQSRVAPWYYSLRDHYPIVSSPPRYPLAVLSGVVVLPMARQDPFVKCKAP